MPSKTKLGKFLRARRLELELRQIDIVKLADIRQTYYSALETGKIQSPRQKCLKGLSRALRCEISQLKALIREQRKPETELGRLIFDRREQLELRQKKFADRFKMGLTTIGELERGVNRGISYRLVKPLANALGLKPSALNKYVTRWEKPNNSRLGRLVRARRKKLGLSLAQVGNKIEATRQFMSQIELGQCPLSENGVLIKRLAEALKLDVSKLQAVRPKRKKRKSLRKTKVKLMPSPRNPDRPRKHIRLSDQNLRDLRKIKEISDINNNSEIITRALELLRKQLEKPT